MRARALLALSVVVSLLVGGGAFASHNATPGVVGGFEIDGDFVFPTAPALPNETRDWDNVGGVVRADDAFNDGTDDVFGGGSKEQEPNNWTFTAGPKPPGKDDLTRAYFAKDIGASGMFMFMGFERLAIQGQGDAHIDFEFNRNGTTIVNGAGETIPERSDGDLLIIYDYPGGTNPVALEVRTWDGDLDNPLTPQNEEALFGVWNLASLPATSAFADINGTSTARPAAVPFGGGTVAAKRFGEVGLDVSSIFGGSFVRCPGFSSFWAKSRSSGESFNSALKDKVGPVDVDFSACATKNWSFTFNPQPIAGAQVFAVYTVSGGETRSVELTDPDGDGTFTASDDEIPPGSVSYHFEVKIGSNLVWRSDHDPNLPGDQDGTESFAIAETKTNSASLHYDVTLTPANAENFAGTPHTLTARIFEVGTNKPLPNVTLNFETFGGTPSGCGSLSPASGVSDASGEVQTVLTSSDPCTTSIRVWVNGSTASSTSGFDTGEANATATKAFVRYLLSVNPPQDVNEANDPHTFTIILTKDSGSGPVPVSGASVHLSLSTGGTDAHFTAINGQPAGGTEADCLTDANGQCTATVVASQTGEISLTATYQASAGGETREISSGGIKRYVDASITITPGQAVNEVGTPHTFTITVRAFPDGTGTPTFGPISPTVSPAPDSQNSTCDSPTISGDGNTATCTVTITDAQAGTFTVNASASVTMGGVTVTRSTSGNSGPGGTGPAVKHFVDAAVTIGPSGVNEVGLPHTFLITVSAFPAGTGTPSFTIGTDVSPAPTSQNSTCNSPTISDDGNTATCILSINSDSPTTYTANASASVTMGGVTVSRSTAGNSGPGGTGPATKVYVRATVEKLACPDVSAARGTPLEYTIGFTIEGATLHNVTVSDDLSSSVVFLGASDIAGETPSTPAPGSTNGAVVWSFASLAPGSYQGTIDARVSDNAPLDQNAHNEVTLDADEITSKVDTHDLLVTNEGTAASGRAFGVRVDLLGDGMILGDPDVAPTPDSDVANPGELTRVDDPFGGSDPAVTLLRVSEADQSGSNSASYTALATTSDVHLDVPGVVLVEADSVVAKSTSLAHGAGAVSSSAGSRVQDLRVNGTQHGDVSEPTTIDVRDPLSGALLAQVRVLEKLPSGAAAGQAQPNGNAEFTSGMAVNAIHVIVYDLPTPLVNEASDVIVAHADTTAAFPSALGCDVTIPRVSGIAYALDVFNLNPDPGNARVAEVILPITGGAESATLADFDAPAGLGTSDSAFTSTIGEISDGPDANTIDVEAHTLARTEGLDLAGGTITATKIESTSDSTLAGSSGDATIADLVIAGNNICGMLMLTSTCEPDPNTVLLLPGVATIVMLNEQISGTGELTVNAVHIWVLGDTNPFGLPAGAEIIISSVHSDAHPAP